MNEHEFRQRFRQALGEPPQAETAGRLERLTRGRPQRRSLGALGSIAATLVLVMVAGVVGWRLSSQRTSQPTTVRPTPTVQAWKKAIDPSSCRLPVVIQEESGPPGRLTSQPGFVDTKTGQYRQDASASLSGLPGGAFEGTDVKPARPAVAVWYDEVVGRWLPVGPPDVAPDGRSYAWIRLLPPGSNFTNMKTSELRRYDLSTHSDRLLWSYAGQLMIWQWDATGILVEGNPVSTSAVQPTDWVINPATGAATVAPKRNMYQGPVLLPGENGYGSFGNDGKGHQLYRMGSRQQGDQEWIFYESAPGLRVTIYKGTQGDAMGFDPSRAMSDATGIWFSDFEMHGVWHWDLQNGLHKIRVSGLPPLLAGANSSLYVDPAGPCM